MLPAGQAAVYAFYEAIKLKGVKPADEIDTYAVANARTITLDLTSLPNAVTIKLRGTSQRFKGKGKRYVESVKDADREAFCNTLHFLSILNEPLYVGETEDVKIRFLAHHDKDFLYHMKEKGKSPSDFIFFYYALNNNTHRAVETVLIHLLSPSGNTIGSLTKREK